MISRRGLFGALAALVGGGVAAKLASKPKGSAGHEAWAREHMLYGHLGAIEIDSVRTFEATPYASAAEALKHARAGDTISAFHNGRAYVYTIERA